jgi:predicted O-methyltransferase YrrM
METNINLLVDTNYWFNYQEFYDGIANRKYDTLVEVGVWKGHSISYLAKKIKNLNYNPKIYAVDLFEDTIDEEWNKNLKEEISLISKIYNKVLENNEVRDMITDIKGLSWEMAKNFEDNSVDFVFIDAGHEYESVVKDINAWLPKIRKGGIISGHDYFNPCGVKQAVDELIKDVKFSNDKIWYKEI